MQVELEAYTDVASFLIFDPGAIGRDPEADSRSWDELIDAAAADGTAIAYSYASDGGAAFRVLIDEDPPSAWLDRRECGIERARLRVPSGRLMAAGAEYVWPEPSREHVTEAEVPPGDYSVDAFDVAWEEDALDAELRALVGAGTVRLADLSGFLIGLGIFGTFLGVCSIGWSFLEQSWTPLKVAGVMVGAYWAVVIPLLILTPWAKAMDRVDAARREIAREHPSTVLWLQPIADPPPPPFTVGKFGSAHVEPTRQERASLLGCAGSAIVLLMICLIIALIITLVATWMT